MTFLVFSVQELFHDFSQMSYLMPLFLLNKSSKKEDIVKNLNLPGLNTLPHRMLPNAEQY